MWKSYLTSDIHVLVHQSQNLTTAMFKCGSCTYVGGHVNGKGPCPMCNNELLSGHRDLDSVMDVVEATRLALDPNLV